MSTPSRVSMMPKEEIDNEPAGPRQHLSNHRVHQVDEDANVERAVTAYRGRSSKIIAAPFSAIIMAGEFVLPEVIDGITEASITRRRSMPMTRSRASTTARGSMSRPMRAVPTGGKLVGALSTAG